MHRTTRHLEAALADQAGVAAPVQQAQLKAVKAKGSQSPVAPARE